MKILNLFAGIGGNRSLWGDHHEITAVEFNKNIAEIYQRRFPKDIVINEDAIKYIEYNLDNFDFVWASPSCVTHSRLNIPMVAQLKRLPHIPDDKTLYGLIRWLKKFSHGSWVVENTLDYLGFLIRPTQHYGRHYFWSNLPLPYKKFTILKDIDHKSWGQLADFHKIARTDIPFLKWDRNNDMRRTILRNCVDQKIGKYILDCVIRPKQTTLKIEKKLTPKSFEF